MTPAQTALVIAVMESELAAQDAITAWIESRLNTTMTPPVRQELRAQWATESKRGRDLDAALKALRRTHHD